MSAYTLADWSDFFVAVTGAAGALTGLVIVAVSINISVILKNPELPGRAGESVVMLAGILVLSTLGTVPGQPDIAAGIEFIAVGAGIWFTTTAIQVRALHRKNFHPSRKASVVVAQFASLPLIIGGVSLIAGTGGGLYWLVPGVVIGLLGGVMNTWVLLVEILR